MIFTRVPSNLARRTLKPNLKFIKVVRSEVGAARDLESFCVSRGFCLKDQFVLAINGCRLDQTMGCCTRLPDQINNDFERRTR